MRPIKTLICAAFLLAFLSGASSAKYITLSPTMTMETIISGNESRINVSIINSGDEPAYEVQLSLLLPDGFSSNPIYFGRVDPGARPQLAAFNLSVSDSLDMGKYSAALLTEYKDANGYPFSSVSPQPLFIKEIKSSGVGGALQETELGTKEKKKIKLEMRNMDYASRDLEIKVYAPKELKVEPMEKTLSIDSRGEAEAEFEISSFGALSGSSYVVFAAIDYEDRGVHYSSTASGMVRLVEQKDSFGFTGWLPAAGVVVLVLLIVYYQFRR